MAPPVLILRVGSTTAQDVALNSGGCMVTNYPMNSPTINQEALSDLQDGDTLSVPTFGNVSETIELMIQGTPTAIAAKIEAIERLLDLARQGTIGYLDDRVYLVVQYESDTEAWRSQILAAQWMLPDTAGNLYRGTVTGSITITRRYFWETEALHAVAVTSAATTTPTTGYANVYNADDSSATNRNWWQCAADQVTGSLPAPAVLSLKNNSGAARYAATIFLGNYVYSEPTTVDPILRGAQAAGGSGTANATESDLWWWAAGNLTTSFKNQFGRVIAIFSTRPNSTTLLRASLQYRLGAPVDVAQGEQVISPSSEYAIDLGGLPLPPGGYWQNSSAASYVALKGKTPGFDDPVGINWLQVMPSGWGRFRTLRGISGSLQISAGNDVVDDGSEGGVYLLSGTDRYPFYRPYFAPIYLWPNKINRIAFVVSSSFAMETGQAWQAKLQVRPRRLTI